MKHGPRGGKPLRTAEQKRRCMRGVQQQPISQIDIPAPLSPYPSIRCPSGIQVSWSYQIITAITLMIVTHHRSRRPYRIDVVK